MILPACKTSKKSAEIHEKPKEKITYNFYEKYSDNLGYQLIGTENKLLVTTVSDWLGTPYKYSGCDRNGTDCSCLVKNIYKQVYGIDLDRRSIEIFKSTSIIKKENLEEGDLLFFITSGKTVNHIGIYISASKFVHSSTTKGVMISDINEEFWIKTFYKAGRVKK